MKTICTICTFEENGKSLQLVAIGSGGRIRTFDLRVMSPKVDFEKVISRRVRFRKGSCFSNSIRSQNHPST